MHKQDKNITFTTIDVINVFLDIYSDRESLSITPDTNLELDLDITDTNILALCHTLDERFSVAISLSDIDGFTTIQDIIDYVALYRKM